MILVDAKTGDEVEPVVVAAESGQRLDDSSACVFTAGPAASDAMRSRYLAAPENRPGGERSARGGTGRGGAGARCREAAGARGGAVTVRAVTVRASRHADVRAWPWKRAGAGDSPTVRQRHGTGARSTATSAHWPACRRGDGPVGGRALAERLKPLMCLRVPTAGGTRASSRGVREAPSAIAPRGTPRRCGELPAGPAGEVARHAVGEAGQVGGGILRPADAGVHNAPVTYRGPWQCELAFAAGHSRECGCSVRAHSLLQGSDQ